MSETNGVHPTLAPLDEMARLGKWDLDGLAHRSTAWWIADHGLRDDGRAVVEALVRLTTYGHDLDAMSADVPVTQLRLGKVLYLDGGWQRLVDALSARTTVVAAQANAISHDGDDLVVEVDCGADHGRLPRHGPAHPAAPSLHARRRRPALPVHHCPPADLAPDGGAVVRLMRAVATPAGGAWRADPPSTPPVSPGSSWPVTGWGPTATWPMPAWPAEPPQVGPQRRSPARSR